MTKHTAILVEKYRAYIAQRYRCGASANIEKSARNWNAICVPRYATNFKNQIQEMTFLKKGYGMKLLLGLQFFILDVMRAQMRYDGIDDLRRNFTRDDVSHIFNHQQL